MATSPQAVADVLAEAAMLEAERIRERAAAGELSTQDRMSLQFLWRVAADAANAEWSQMHKLDPSKFNDELLRRALGEDTKKPGRRQA
jgi:hypothetical protein